MTTPLHARQRGPLGWALLLLAILLLSSRPNHAQTVDSYSFSASSGTFTPLPATATAVTTISSDDALTGAISLGFNFVFDGNTYTQVYVSSNGTVSFNSAAPVNGAASYANALSSVSAASRPFVAPYWDDLTGVGGTASYQTTGTAGSRVFTFEWLNWTNRVGTGGPISFQAKLIEGTNEVRFVYRQGATAPAGASASIGLAGNGTGSGSFLSLSNASATPAASSTAPSDNVSTFPATGQIYSFTPPVPSACPQPRNLISAASSNSAIIQFTVTNSSPGPFTIQYGLPGFDPTQATSSTNVYTTVSNVTPPYIITGLAPSTTYQFYVTQNCGGTAGSSPRSTAGTIVTEPEPAPNDNCAQAVPLTVGATCAAPTTGTVYAASQSLSPLTSCTSTTANDVWYSFVANGTTQTVTFTPQFAGIVDIRSGTCASSTSVYCMAASAGSTATNNVVGLTASQTYYVRVYASGTSQPVPTSANFTLCVATGPAVPANDNCAQAIPLTVGATCAAQASGSVFVASQSLAPLTSCASTTANDVWYSFVANGSTQTLTFTPQFAGIVDIRSGTCASSTSVYCAAATANATISSNVVGLTASQTYYVRVYASGTTQPVATSAGFTLCVATGPAAPTNDNCANAIPLTINAACATPASGSVFVASQSLAPLTSCASTTANDVWYSFVANGSSQIVTFTPRFAGIVDIRSGTCASSTSVFCATAGANATVSTNVGGLTASQTYYVRVYASGATQPVATSAGFTLCVTTGPSVPANNECANAIPLSVGNTCTGPVIGTVLAATQSLAPTPGCAGTNANDVWYSFVATGPSQILTFNPQFDGAMNVRSGACTSSTSLTCTTTTANVTKTITVAGLTANQTYYVRVYASTSAVPSPAVSTFLLCASGAPIGTGTRAQADTDALLVYPNPSNSGQLTLRLANSAGSGQATLLNALGQTVRQQRLSNAAEQTLSTRNLAAGLYTLRVTVGEQVLTRKVVLQ